MSQAGCSVRLDASVPAPLPQPVSDAVVLQGQAQFQPQAYVAHIAALATQAGAQLYEHSRVIELDAKARRAATATGAVKAQEIVLATHTPKGFHVVQAEMPVHREYGIARPLTGADPGPGVFWWRGDERYSVRTMQWQGRNFLVCVGQEHKVGIHNAKASLMVMESAIEQQFGAGEVSHRWSAQNYRSADGLPYIGRDFSGCFIATGFSTDGLVWGTVSAQIIAGQLMGRSPEFGELCKPGRFSPVKGGKTMLEEVGTMTMSLVKDYLTHRQGQQLSSLAPQRQRDHRSRGRIVRRLPRTRRRAVRRVPGLYASGMQGALEQRGNQLGLHLPRQPVQAGRDGDRGTGDLAAQAQAPERRVTLAAAGLDAQGLAALVDARLLLGAFLLDGLFLGVARPVGPGPPDHRQAQTAKAPTTTPRRPPGRSPGISWPAG